MRDFEIIDYAFEKKEEYFGNIFKENFILGGGIDVVGLDAEGG